MSTSADGREVRKGAAASVAHGSRENGGTRLITGQTGRRHLRGRRHAAGRGREDAARALGVIHLKDIVKEGIAERFAEMRAMGIRTVMITGDNPLTAQSIADESGVDDFLAEATPEDEIGADQEGAGGRQARRDDRRRHQRRARPAPQADVGVAMNTGTSAAKRPGNMVDLDSNPTKLIDIVEIGKQLLITRGR